MNLRTLILRTLAYHWRSNVGAILAAAAGCAVLTGALIVGDSVRFSLLRMATERLGAIDVALLGQDRFFKADLAERVATNGEFKTTFGSAQSILLLPGVAANDGNELRANDVQVCGVSETFSNLDTVPDAVRFVCKSGQAIINQKLATVLQAKAGDSVRVRLYKPGILPQDAPLGGRDDAAAFLRVKIQAVVPDHGIGSFALFGGQTTALNVFVPIGDLQRELERPGRANVLAFAAANHDASKSGAAHAQSALKAAWSLADAELKLREQSGAEPLAELSTGRVFLDDALAAPLLHDDRANGIVTYFVNAIRSGEHAIPYSMATAAGAPLVPNDMADSEIVLNQWAADDLGAKPGDAIELDYFSVGLQRALDTHTEKFTLKAVVPIEGVHADRQLMPAFPGIDEAESTQDWKAGIPIDMKKIRPKDEAYWKKYRGTPKAFVTLRRGIEMWKNRFGTYTALRFPLSADTNQARDALVQIEAHATASAQPEKLGLPLIPVKTQALAGVDQAMDFGGLFIGLSFFLIAAALLLMALIFQFEIETRARETGVLLALGFKVRTVRWLLWSEGVGLALCGALPGALIGILYAQYLIHGLSTSWQSAVGNAPLTFHAEPLSIGIGVVGTLSASALAIFFAVRKQAASSAKSLLGGQVVEDHLRARTPWMWWVFIALGLAGAGALTVLALKGSAADAAGMFFGAGGLLLLAAIGIVRVLLTDRERSGSARPSLFSLGFRAARRRPGRSLATAALLASGTFLVCAIGVNEMDANLDASNKASGTGGFTLVGRATIPVFDNLNTPEGRNKAGVPDDVLAQTTIYPLRVKAGEEAS